MTKKSMPEDQIRRLEEIRLFIKTWRTNQLLSQQEYSNMANTHVNTLQKFESQKTINISILTLFAFIDAMDGMTLSDFFAGME